MKALRLFLSFFLLILLVDVSDARSIIQFSVPPRAPGRGLMGGRIGMEIRNPVSGPGAVKNNG